MALDVTIGGADANSYVTLGEASTYFANHYSLAKSASWVALNSLQQESALRRACEIIDGLRVLDDEYGYGPLPPALIVYDFFDLNLHRLLWDQRLSFPRNIDVDDDLVAFILPNVQDAQCEQASYLLTFDEDAMIATLSGISEDTVRAGPVMVRRKYGTTHGAGAIGSMIAPMALELMRPYIRRTSRVRRA